MMIQQTIEKLRGLKLSGMADALVRQLETGTGSDLTLEERLSFLVDCEWTLRQERITNRRIKQAHLRMDAAFEDIDLRTPRGFEREQMLELGHCRWVKAGRNLILSGPTGIGKTWIACALTNKVCRLGLNAHYLRVPRLLESLNIARGDGTYLKTLGKLVKYDLLVLDDWGLSRYQGEMQNTLLEVLDDRVGRRSVLVTTQLPIDKWHYLFDEPTVADAILDRLLGQSIQIKMKGDSLR